MSDEAEDTTDVSPWCEDPSVAHQYKNGACIWCGARNLLDDPDGVFSALERRVAALEGDPPPKRKAIQFFTDRDGEVITLANDGTFWVYRPDAGTPDNFRWRPAFGDLPQPGEDDA